MPFALDPSDLFDKPATPTEEPSPLRQIGGGLLVGLRRDPIAGFFVNQIADALPNASREDLDNLEAELDGKGLAQVAAFAGEWGSSIGLGLGAYAGGRLLARAALSRLAPGLAERGAASLVGRQAQQYLMREGAQAAGFTGAARLLRPGGLERGAEIVGGALGVGAQAGTGTALQGGDAYDIAESFATAAVLSGAFEGAIYGAARALSPRMKAGGYIDETGQIAGLDKAKEFTKEINKSGYEIGYAATGKQWNTPNTAGAPSTSYVRQTIGGEGYKLQKTQRDLNKLLAIDDYERGLTSHPEQLELFPLEAKVTPKGTEQLSLRSNLSRKEMAKLRKDYFEDGQKPKIDFVPEGTTRRELARAQAIKVLRAKAGEQRGILVGKRRLFPEEGIEDVWNSQRPYDVDTMFGKVRELVSRYTEGPMNLGKRLGMTGKRSVEMIERAEVNSLIKKEKYSEILYDRFTQIAKAIGAPTTKKSKNFLEHYDGALSKFFQTIEEDGVEAATRRFGSGPTTMAMEILDDLKKVYEPLVPLGAQPLLAERDLAERGLKTWLPHVAKYGSKDFDTIFKEVVEGLQKPKWAGGEALSKMEAEAKAARILYTDFHEGLKQFGSIDKRRNFTGSLVKQQEHFPMEGYDTGIFRYAHETTRRNEYARYFGLDGQLSSQLIAMARREGADAGAFAGVLDHFLNRKYYNQAAVAWSRRVINLQAATKLTFATIPNLFQPLVNNAPAFGLIRTVRGMGAIARNSLSEMDSSMVAKAIALNEEYMAAARHIHMGHAETRITDRIADIALKTNLFDPSERVNRLSTGIAALFQIRETLGKRIAGRVKGKHLDFARRQFREAGLDFDKIIVEAKKNVGGTIDEAIAKAHDPMAIERAIYSLTRQTQFTPVSTRIPLAWQSPLGRVLTQFKSFAFNQGIMIRDNILAEAAMGNIKPLATATAIYPTTGYVVYKTLEAMKDKKKEQTDLGRFLSMTSSVGGLGISSSMILSAYYGRLNDFLVGPTITDIASGAQSAALAAVNGDMKYIWGQVERQPAYMGARAIAKGTALGVDELVDLVGQTAPYDDEGAPGTTYEELIRGGRR